MVDSGLTFKEDGHEYRYNGMVVPSVTQILGGMKRIEINGFGYYVTETGEVISEEKINAGGDHGDAVHKAVHIIATEGQDALDWFNLDEDLTHPLEEFCRWEDIFKPEYIYCEKLLYSESMQFAGTLDILARIDDKIHLIDIKSGELGLVGPQTGGYLILARELPEYLSLVNPYLSTTHVTALRYALHLPKKGSMKYIPLTDPHDEAEFKSRHFIYNRNFKRKRGL